MSLVRIVRLRVPSGAAKPGPSIGQALGPLGVNMAQFCKEFNEKSADIYEKDTPLGVDLSAFSDRSYTFEIRTPPTPWLIRKAIGMPDDQKGTSEPNVFVEPFGSITPEAVYEIALIKKQDDKYEISLQGIAKSVVGTAKSMGIVVREEEDAIPMKFD